MNMFIYVAAPYSHPDPAIEDDRVKQITSFMAKMVKCEDFLPIRYLPLSPVVHCHEIARVSGLDGSWETWQPYCFKLLDLCQIMVVLKLPGWIESKGVQAECEEAARRMMPVLFSEPDLENLEISGSHLFLSLQ